MIVFNATTRRLTPIAEFHSHGAESAELATGCGDAHVHIVRIVAGGEIGPHVAGFGQLFVCVEGSGWVAGANDERVPISSGEVAYFPRGERHSKGSAEGLRALIIQVRELELCDEAANGFERVGEVIDPEDGLVWRWERR